MLRDHWCNLYVCDYVVPCPNKLKPALYFSWNHAILIIEGEEKCVRFHFHFILRETRYCGI